EWVAPVYARRELAAGGGSTLRRAVRDVGSSDALQRCQRADAGFRGDSGDSAGPGLMAGFAHVVFDPEALSPARRHSISRALARRGLHPRICAATLSARC